MYIRKDAIGNCVLFLHKTFFSVNKSWNIANLRFFGCRLSQKELMIGGLKRKKILFALHAIESKTISLFYNVV